MRILTGLAITFVLTIQPAGAAEDEFFFQSNRVQMLCSGSSVYAVTPKTGRFILGQPFKSMRISGAKVVEKIIPTIDQVYILDHEGIIWGLDKSQSTYRKSRIMNAMKGAVLAGGACMAWTAILECTGRSGCSAYHAVNSFALFWSGFAVGGALIYPPGEWPGADSDFFQIEIAKNVRDVTFNPNMKDYLVTYADGKAEEWLSYLDQELDRNQSCEAWLMKLF